MLIAMLPIIKLCKELEADPPTEFNKAAAINIIFKMKNF